MLSSTKDLSALRRPLQPIDDNSNNNTTTTTTDDLKQKMRKDSTSEKIIHYHIDNYNCNVYYN